jgi:hypothetical protein
MKWINVPEWSFRVPAYGNVTVHSFVVSDSSVLFSSFLAFATECGYRTSAERSGSSATFRENLGIDEMKRKKVDIDTSIPMYLSYEDAGAYCDYYGFRLLYEYEFYSLSLRRSPLSWEIPTEIEYSGPYINTKPLTSIFCSSANSEPLFVAVPPRQFSDWIKGFSESRMVIDPCHSVPMSSFRVVRDE